MHDSQHEIPDPRRIADSPLAAEPDKDPRPIAAQADQTTPMADRGTAQAERSAGEPATQAVPTGEPARSLGDKTAPAEDLTAEEDEEQSSTRLHVIVGSLIASAVIIAILLGIFTQANESKLEPGKPVPGAEETMKLLAGIPQHDFTLGKPHAPLTLTEFGDLKSTAAAAFSKEGLPRIISRYVRPGRLRIVFRPLALIGQESERAAEMAAALAPQGKLWQFVDLMYRNQGQEGTAYVNESYLAAITTAITGARLAPAVQARESATVKAELAQASAQAHRLRLSSTPAFLLSRSGGPPQRVTATQILSPAAFSEAVEGLKR